MIWTYPHGDPALLLFTAFKARFGLELPADATVLELGCAETDFLERASAQNSAMTFIGVDARVEGNRDAASNRWFMVGDACDPSLFEPEYFDAVILLGALEHFGLGYYGDPLHEDGDKDTLANVARWLKPGGWVYFDVPSNPTDYITKNRHFRVYSPVGVDWLVASAGLEEEARAYSLAEPADHWCEPPTEAVVPYVYCAVKARKAA